MWRLVSGIVFVVWWMLFALPPRLLALLASLWLGLILWLNRRRHNRLGIIGAEAAAFILTKHGLKTTLASVPSLLADCYLPRQNTVMLSTRTYHGTSIASLAIAAHEAGHAIQHKRWFLPWCARRLLVLPANLGLSLCLWVWLIGVVIEDQRVLIAAASLFGLYLLFLLFELICEIDATRRGVRELIRHHLLDSAESRIARRVLHSALLTYIAFFGGSLVGLAFFLSGLDWPSAVVRPSSSLQDLQKLVSIL